MDVRIRRAYDPPGRDDGHRVLIDRIWPRGVRKEELRVDEWARALAPSTRLRQWFGHDPARWEAFRKRYFAELDRQAEAVAALAERARRGRVTLVYGAKDEQHNNAVALRDYLTGRAGGSKRGATRSTRAAATTSARSTSSAPAGARATRSSRTPRTRAPGGAGPSLGSRRAGRRGSRRSPAPRSRG